MKIDEKHKQKAVEQKLVIFKFEIDRRYSKNNVVVKESSVGVITAEQDAEFKAMLKRWDAQRI